MDKNIEIIKQAAKIALANSTICNYVMYHIRYGGGLSSPIELLEGLNLKDVPAEILKLFKGGGMPFTSKEDMAKLIEAKKLDPMIEILACEEGAKALMTETIK
jgi:hypothetical protein